MSFCKSFFPNVNKKGAYLMLGSSKTAERFNWNNNLQQVEQKNPEKCVLNSKSEIIS